MEEQPYDLDFLKGYEQLQFKKLGQALSELKPDLLIILDANTISRITRDVAPVKSYLDTNQTSIVIIDHHVDKETDKNDIYINHSNPAVTLDIYEIFIETLGMQKPSGYAQTAITGIYTDTGGFVHRNLNFKKVFDVVPKLISDGADLELTVNKLNKISQQGLGIVGELIKNTKYQDNFTYSFISDETAERAKHESLIKAAELFRSQFLRNVKDHPWGFIVYVDTKAQIRTYSVSLRSLTDQKDVSIVAALLGGGGHKPAAGAKILAASVHEATQQALDAVEKSEHS